MFLSVLKTIIAGAAAGVFLFAVPFILFKFLFFFLFAGLLLRILGIRRARRWHAYQQFSGHAGYGHPFHGPGMYREVKEGLKDSFGKQPQNI